MVETEQQLEGLHPLPSLKAGQMRCGLVVRLEARSGKEADVERLLTGSLTGVQKEAGTRGWFALRLGPASFGVFNVFPDITARNAHLAGEVISRLKVASTDLLTSPLQFEEFDVLASKIPRL